MYSQIEIKSQQRQELIEITAQVQAEISASGVGEGICLLYCPHTTAALTVNSCMDPATAVDLQNEVDRLVPTRTNFHHTYDTPSDAAGHIKASLLGGQEAFIIHHGKLVIGSSQGIFFWEYDGPRTRQVHLKILAG
jgi:secondary thiamine-phosphate synthase enzyme